MKKKTILATAFVIPVLMTEIGLQSSKVKASEEIHISKEEATQTTKVSTNKDVPVNKENTENDKKVSNSKTDSLNFIKVSITADPTSSGRKVLSCGNAVYALKFVVTNDSKDNEVIPIGTKFKISVEPDSRIKNDNFLKLASLNSSNNDFSIADNQDGTYEVSVLHDLKVGEYKFIVNFFTQNPGYDWDQPWGTNMTNPDPAPGKVRINFQQKDIFVDNFYINPRPYQAPGTGSKVPGYAGAGFNDNSKLLNIDPEYPNESNPMYLDDGTAVRNPNDKSKSGFSFFGYVVNYQATIGGQAGAKLGIKSKDKFDLDHYHLLMEKDDKIVDITNDPLLKWDISDNEINVDASDFLIKNNYWNQLFLRVFVPEKTIDATNFVKSTVGWYHDFVCNSIFQDPNFDTNTTDESEGDSGNTNSQTQNSNSQNKEEKNEDHGQTDSIDSSKAEELTLKHDAYLYDSEGKRANRIILAKGSIITAYGTTTINDRNYYILVDKEDNNKKYYVAVGNIKPVVRKIIRRSYVYNQYGERIKKAGVLKVGSLINAYGAAVDIRGKRYFEIDNNRYVKSNNSALTIKSASKIESELVDSSKNSQEATLVTKNLMHNAYLYSEAGMRSNGLIFKAGSSIETINTKLINGKKYYELKNGLFIAAGNSDAKEHKLKHNAYLYNRFGKRIGKKVIKKNSKRNTYGNPVKIKNKKYYIVGVNKFIKKSNF